jgi:hypothetical protein
MDLTRQHIPSSYVCEGRKWIVEDKDLVSSIRYIHDRNLTFRQWLTSFRGIQESAWFAFDDPLPLFLMGKQFLNRITDHLFRLSSGESNHPFWEHLGSTP